MPGVSEVVVISYIRTLMAKKHNNYSVYHKVSSILMMLALLWLTVSIPYVFNAQKKLLGSETHQSVPVNTQQEEEASNPFANTTEEKTPGSSNTLSEFLHEIELLKQPSENLTRFYKYHRYSLYIAFHGELLVPPPNC
jgi:hypothetical protein